MAAPTTTWLQVCRLSIPALSPTDMLRDRAGLGDLQDNNIAQDTFQTLFKGDLV